MTERLEFRFRFDFEAYSNVYPDTAVAIAKTNAGTWDFLFEGLSFALATLGGAAVGALICAVLDVTGTTWWILCLVAAGTGLWFHVTQFGRQIDMLLKTIGNSALMQDRLTVAATPEGVRMSSPTADWFTAWSGVDTMETSENGIGIVVAGLVIIVPAAAIAEVVPLDDAVDLLTRWRDAAA